MSDVNDGEPEKSSEPKAPTMNDHILSGAEDSREGLCQDVQSTVAGVSEKPKGKSLLVLEMRRRSKWLNRGTVPK